MTQHVLSARQFSRSHLEDIFEEADLMAKTFNNGGRIEPVQSTRGLALLFFQPSTRTHSSFQIAATRLGIKIVYSSQQADKVSSVAKHESLEHTIEYYCSSFQEIGAIVIRHPEDFAAERAAEIADPFNVSIINAGDGTNEHPTQALTDLFTIWRKENGNLENTRLAVCNDLLRSRTIHSLCLMLGRNYHPQKILACAPEGVSLPQNLQKEIKSFGVEIEKSCNLKEVASWAKFLYMTRPQTEYLGQSDESVYKDFVISRDFLESLPHELPCLVMHPMPVDSVQFNEIAPDACHHRRCIMFEQARNGVFVRMALLKELFKER